jgi:hypothetical protein
MFSSPCYIRLQPTLPRNCVLRIAENLRPPQDVRPNCDSPTLKRVSRNSSVGVVTRLGSEQHGVRLAVQSMDNLFSKTPRPNVFQCLCPGDVWLPTILHVVLRIRMSGAVPPFLIRQTAYITFHSEGSYDIRMTAHYSALGLWEIKRSERGAAHWPLRRRRALRPYPLHPFLFRCCLSSQKLAYCSVLTAREKVRLQAEERSGGRAVGQGSRTGSVARQQ